jgi:hypothetical protein
VLASATVPPQGSWSSVGRGHRMYWTVSHCFTLSFTTLIQKATRFSWLPARMSVIKLFLAPNEIPKRGRHNYLAPTRSSPQIFLTLLMSLFFSPVLSKIFSPSPARNSSKVFGNLSMYLFPARNLPRYSPSQARNSFVGVPVLSQEFSSIFPFPCPGNDFTKVISIINKNI